MAYTFHDVSAYRMAALMRALDSREILAAQGTELKLVYRFGDPSAPQGVMWIGDKDVPERDARSLQENILAVREILKAPKC